jgi:hypothetical protein
LTIKQPLTGITKQPFSSLMISEILMAENMKITVYSDVTLCNLVKVTSVLVELAEFIFRAENKPHG